ncbi:MAG: GIY-YIG nuclease family protein [Rickettsiales bacterium]|jgi:putative endonuclease|nr:GIY-YIG nuclease family protein [Rickettsiales bacterium]
MKLTLEKEYHFWVYILFDRKGGGTYIGITNDLTRRMLEHKNGTVEGFTKEKNIHKLGYYEYYKYINNAIAREKMLKKWNRAWKYRLIETMNPEWKDLAEELDKVDIYKTPTIEDLIDPRTGEKVFG